MKQQFTNALSLVDSKNVKQVLNSSQWDFTSIIPSDARIIRYMMNKLNKGLITEKTVKEKIEEHKMCISEVNPHPFDNYYNSIHPYNEGEELNISDLIDNVNYWFAQFIAHDIALTFVPFEHSFDFRYFKEQNVLQSYTFFIK